MIFKITKKKNFTCIKPKVTNLSKKKSQVKSHKKKSREKSQEKVTGKKKLVK